MPQHAPQGQRSKSPLATGLTRTFNERGTALPASSGAVRAAAGWMSAAGGRLAMRQCDWKGFRLDSAMMRGRWAGGGMLVLLDGGARLVEEEAIVFGGEVCGGGLKKVELAGGGRLVQVEASRGRGRGEVAFKTDLPFDSRGKSTAQGKSVALMERVLGGGVAGEALRQQRVKTLPSWTERKF